jgi:hypothetical protein
MTGAAEPLWADFERREPRCQICRDENVRVLVNKLLDWHGAPIILGRGKTHMVAHADILRDLEPLNDGRDKSDRISYASLWAHAKRHYELAGTAAYFRARMEELLINALEG